jgi:hypothetical protein
VTRHILICGNCGAEFSQKATEFVSTELVWRFN